MNQIKSIGRTSGSYASSLGTTAYLLISAYIAANPDSRWDASLKEVLGVAEDMYGAETELKKLNKKYDYSLDKMLEYDASSQIMNFDIVSKYEESYNDDILGWLDKQYDSFVSVGKRTMYLANDSYGAECIVIPENMFEAPGEYELRVALADTLKVEKNGFAKTLSVYYEISTELSDQIAEDYGEYESYELSLAEQEDILYDLLNKIE